MKPVFPPLLLLVLLGPLAAQAAAAPLPAVQVQADGHYLQTDDGRPFFWLGDTAWELIHATTRDECSYYLRTRARQGFTVIQTNVLGEMDGLNKPTPDGLRPFQENDPAKPNEAYFDRVAQIVDEAAACGLYVALLPAWGDKLTAPWGAGPRIFTLDKLPVVRAYARYLGGKLKGLIVRDWLDRQDEFEKEVGGYFRAGRLRSKETVVTGLDQAVGAFVGLFEGKNVGKMVVRLC